MDVLLLLLNAITVIFIGATMLAAGLGATLGVLRAAFSDWRLLVLVLLVNLAVIPLLGWGLAVVFGLATAPFIALLLIASSPGGPFGAKLGMIQAGDVTSGAAMQVLLAAVGSITFGFTATWLLTAADVGGGISLDVGALVRTVAILQVVPFAVGLVLRHYATETALSWHPTTVKVSNVSFLMVLAGMLLGNWSDIVALLGTRSLLAGFLFSGISFGLGAADHRLRKAAHHHGRRHRRPQCRTGPGSHRHRLQRPAGHPRRARRRPAQRPGRSPPHRRDTGPPAGQVARVARRKVRCHVMSAGPRSTRITSHVVFPSPPQRAAAHHRRLWSAVRGPACRSGDDHNVTSMTAS